MHTNLENSLDSFKTLRDLFSDPDKYQAKYDELNSILESNKAYVEAIGPVSQIKILRDETEQINKEAKENLKSAKAKADFIILEASNKAQEIINQSNEKSFVMEQSFKDREVLLDDRESVINKEREALDLVGKELSKKTDQLRNEKEKFELLKDQQYQDYVVSKELYEKAKNEILAKFDHFVSEIRGVSVAEGD